MKVKHHVLTGVLATILVAGALAGGALAGSDRNDARATGAAAFVSISTRNNHTCAVTTSGLIWCWGENEYGALGTGNVASSGPPRAVSGVGSASEAAAGGLHSCALTTGGGVRCWGRNFESELGNGTTTATGCLCIATPVDVSGLTSGVAEVSAGFLHTCAVTTGGGLKCWGHNNLGQLGTGNNTDTNVPVDVPGLTSGVAAVAAGGSHTCALTTGGAVKCWGYGAYGQLGDGTMTESSTVPVNVSGLGSGVAAIEGGDDHTCALTTGGGLKCWGANGGRLGNGGTSDSSVPVDVSGLGSGVAAVSAGRGNTCAVTTGGGAKCWGYGSVGELGNGSFSDSTTPVDVSGLASGVDAIALGFAHACALTDAGAIKCWGHNFWGQLGDGTSDGSAVPIDVLFDDVDGDGCKNVQEAQTAVGSQTTGGLRDGKNFWDFFDVPTGASYVRDRSISAQDIFAVVGRFNASGSTTIDPLSTPSAAPDYHTAYDRGPSLGPNAWNLGPANGSIASTDIFAVLGQFGHSCAA